MFGYFYFSIGLILALVFVVGFFYDYYKFRRPRPSTKGNWIPDFFTWFFSFCALSLIIAWPILFISPIIDKYEKYFEE